MFGLLIILVLVLFLPFTVKTIEHNLEYFLFVMGILAAIVGGVLDVELFMHALEDPIKITLAVFIAGVLFKWFQTQLGNAINTISHKMPFPLFIALVVIGLGLLSSIITAIIAALVLVLIISNLSLQRRQEVLLTVISCFSIGLGAALTPIGEPLSTIVVSKMNENFFYLIDLVGPFIIPGVILLGIFAAFAVKRREGAGLQSTGESESYKEIFVRTVKIYLFVFGLTMLGAGFEPLINAYLLDLSPRILYWVNIISAVLDNATLAAAEISPAMSQSTIEAILMGLLISGGMLIPGNIPNIISAGKLNITSKEWARVGLPFGMVIMVVYFVILLISGL
ncbi:DUF1646 domain-containing protein [Caldibacillus sp. 210928-DFI.2.22]|uniref:DUF1646 family protein n=1 Tax=unclassified Caldibacillus TaxID=2641266 RepID=UPI001D06ED4A|nr:MULTISPECIES: DUF1646 family protein [unclassified Caldibacillus]MCB7069705.1 DUF1646 domain-containing protein [Caldibacillus sp. 210928-DFI.2.22]MCB7073176.1 DUF1646 domain-containing protein [Caldibacillus sp. 210928-DFI.2.18]